MENFDLLVALLGGAPLPSDSRIDWPGLLAVASDNKLLLPLTEALSKRDDVPQEVTEKLSAHATNKSLTEIHRAGHLVKLVEQLEQSDIQVKSFKGPTLAQLAHGRVSARECGDIDLLVKPADFNKALGLLLDSGFSYEMEDLPRCYTRFNCGVPINKGRQKLTIDLHYKLFSNGVHFPMDPIWEDEHFVNIQGTPVATFSPEQCFVYLALHGSKHCWRELRWLHDLYCLSPSVDLARLEDFASRQGCMRSVALAFSLLEALWNTDPPAQFGLDDPSLLNESLIYLRVRKPSWPEYHSYQNRCQTSVWQRLRLFLHTWFSPQIHDLTFIDLPPELWFVYYAIRPIRIVGQRISETLRTS